MKILLKKEVCGSREQYKKPTNRQILVKILLVKEVVGPVHSAQDPLTNKIPRETRFSIKKKRKTQTHNRSIKKAIQMHTKFNFCYQFKFFGQ